MIEQAASVVGLGFIYLIVGMLATFLTGGRDSLSTGDTITIVIWPVLLLVGIFALLVERIHPFELGLVLALNIWITYHTFWGNNSDAWLGVFVLFGALLHSAVMLAESRIDLGI